MKINHKLEFMREYIDLVKRLVPINRLMKIYVINPSVDKRHQIEGVLYTYTKGKNKGNAVMGLYLYYQELVFSSDGISVKLKKYSTMDLLRTLAHELAHLIEHEHGPAHAKLEIKILKKFMDRLEQKGYISEENEDRKKK